MYRKLLLLALTPVLAFGQGSQLPKYTVATLPAASTLPSYTVQVLDGANDQDCVTGHGSKNVLCKSNGTAWVPVSPFQSLTTTGTSGPATLNLGVLNIPNYSSESIAIAATSPILVNGGAGPVSSGTATISCDGCGAVALQPVITPPVAGQYVVLYPTTCTAHSDVLPRGTAVCAADGTHASLSEILKKFPSSFPPVNLTSDFSGFALPSSIPAGNVTSVYAFGVTSMDNPSGPGLLGASCSSATILPGGGKVNWPLQQATTITGITGSTISSVHCGANWTNSGANPAGDSIFTASAIGLIVYYTGTPVALPDNLNVAWPLAVDFSSNTLGTDPLFPYWINALKVSDLGVAPNTGPYTVTPVRDGASASDCSSGGGSTFVLCTTTDGVTYTALAGGGSSITLTTTGTSGSATLSSGVLNVPQYQGALTLTTTGTTGPATLSGNTLNVPQYAAGGIPVTTQILAGDGSGNATTTHMDDGHTTASTITSTEPISVAVAGGQGGTLTLTEGTAASASAGSDILYADSTAHCIKQSLNGGSFACLGTGGGGGGPTPFSYTLYIDTGTVKAQNNQTQTVDYSNTDAAVVINDILTARAATGATIYFKNGTYNLNSVFHETTGGYNLYCSICVQPSGSNNAQPSFNFIGESSQSNTANEGTGGVFLNLTTAAETAAGAGNIIAAFFVRPTLTQRIDVPGLYWGPRILIHDVSVVLPANTRGNEHALDTLEASYLELINSQFTFATYSTARGASNLYAVISPDSPSAGAYIRDTGTAPGFDTGFSINANHSILVNTSAYSATTCYTYGELSGTHGTPLQHSSTWIHVEPYDCVNDLVAGANLGNAAEIDLLNYDIEYISTGPWAHVKGIDTVTNGNKLGGHISWDNFETGVGVGSLTTPFTSGSGTHFDVFDGGTAILQWMKLYSLSSDPSSPSDGTLWYNSVGHQLKAQINGSTVVLGSGFTNPMTTLGDTIYGGASGTATRLAGPTTSTHQFLLGDVPVAGAAVAPAWWDLGANIGTYVKATSPIVATQNANDVTLSCPTCGTSSSTNVTVNGGAGLGTANLNDTTPAAAANGLNVKWQNSTSNVSAYVPGDGNSAHFLSGTGTWATPSGSSGLTQISQITTTSNATTITFSSIPGTYTNLYLTCTEQNSGSSNPGVTFIYNNDSGANYFEQFLHTANTTVAGGSGTNSSGFLGSGTPSSIGANYVSSFFMRVYNYANTSWYKTSHGTGNNFTSTTAVLETQETNTWKSTAAITSIKIGLSTADHFTDGTVCTLYGEQ